MFRFVASQVVYAKSRRRYNANERVIITRIHRGKNLAGERERRH